MATDLSGLVQGLKPAAENSIMRKSAPLRNHPDPNIRARSGARTPRATPVIQVIERIYQIIDLLAGHEGAMTLKDISERTGLHPSTAHRILSDLALGRFVDHPEAGSYRLGMRWLELGHIVRTQLNVRDVALAPMQALHRATGQPVNLSVRQGDEIVYIERAWSANSGMQVIRAIGGRAPLHLTSTGKLFLAADEPHRVRAYAVRTGLPGHTRNSITQLAMLERELARARQTGVAHDDEELEPGVRCMAAGIHDDQGKLIAGLSISAPSERMDDGWLPKLKATVGAISAALGYADSSSVH
jgi:DNA-binding IclR family transcriptional regulator